MIKAKEEATEAHVSLRDSVLPCRLGARRAHNKTRTGCGTCKRRRIKCDEGRPTCKNCARCSLACDFDLSRPPPPSSSTGVKRKRGRPMKEWALSPPHEKPLQPSYSLAEPTAALPHLNVDDLQLYHHYLTSASLALGDDVLWGQKVPFLAFEHHYILHLALSISALHRCRKNPADEAKLVPLAEAHHDAALRQVTEQLPQINKANCSALYVATVLIFDYNLARSHSKTHLGPNAERAPFTWLSLFRGVRFTIETMGLAAIFSGCLGAVSSTHQAHVAPSQLEAGHIAWEEPLAKLAELILPVQKPDLRGLYQALVDCYRDVYGTAQEPNHYPNGNIRAVLRWLWVVDDAYIHQARQKEPHALVLLAHFAVLLQSIQCFWFTKGWAQRVVADVTQNLDHDYAEWTIWPREQISCG